ncbi:MAG: RHS repeat-associated core domain-containing protein [Bacteroidota bacterium]
MTHFRDGEGALSLNLRMYDATIGRWNGVDALAEERNWLSTFQYTQNNPILRVDPDGNLDGVYVNENGNFLGTDNNTEDHTVYVTSQETWDEVGGQEGANTAEGTQKLQNSESTVALNRYGEGISISDNTWKDVTNAGGERIEPTVINNSDKTIYYKPEGVEAVDGVEIDFNPGYDEEGAYPIKPNTSLYARVDGVNSHGIDKGEIYRVPTRPNITITVDENGEASSNTYFSLHPSYGETERTGSAWRALNNSIKPTDKEK